LPDGGLRVSRLRVGDLGRRTAGGSRSIGILHRLLVGQAGDLAARHGDRLTHSGVHGPDGRILGPRSGAEIGVEPPHGLRRESPQVLRQRCERLRTGGGKIDGRRGDTTREAGRNDPAARRDNRPDRAGHLGVFVRPA
jgi:hypothetical protein